MNPIDYTQAGKGNLVRSHVTSIVFTYTRPISPNKTCDYAIRFRHRFNSRKARSSFPHTTVRELQNNTNRLISSHRREVIKPHGADQADEQETRNHWPETA